ncbi:MAG: bifunctional phosphopantothenoylcysteine decarboxylase/phosphopantothenate--cysteine ligase CoaBC [Hydrogenovibrio sp.]|uniref:bifunctional phosphopantothenoylcysteine decarboxylase/phosphopantothenate--cysteine ligase CoaBC n=1 Tax=Hydrogenovibrio sp. TaxID=2065821 RepID=UPI002870ABCB|nr:bifunctional phosphopantothenoylcysteine decarboxylase/phosphopantothenate--cysteine ligase CoaBC [Hydrogenovibrio sp.]MDR9499382.1 bifunctional phosphopantothenoylcysteine decarboxylase/phosphopantothenate--cysteine ligase CoaBC [Hydrogenovibrio sp.]
MNILLGVTGGIAAYKALNLVRLYRKGGHEVQVVMTESAQAFVAPLSFQALSGHPVRTELFDAEQEAGMDHIALARWADVLVIAPATANVLAKLSAGLADDLLTTMVLACDRPLVVAPAMNRVMWQQPVTQQNLQALQARGITVVPPGEGEQACGETGEGRLAEEAAIVTATESVQSALSGSSKPKNDQAWLKTQAFLQGKQVVITAGPTQEPIDPVRFLGNRSSGRMGFALAQAAFEAGAEVTLIAGPVALPTPAGVRRVDVTTAQQMLDAVQAEFAQTDVLIGAAAVADYRVAEPSEQKLKKSPDTDELTLKLIKNPDILGWAGQQKARNGGKGPILVGFAAETENLEAHARTKLQTKQLDMICANQVGDNLGFDQPDNALTLITPEHTRRLTRSDKVDQARQLLQVLLEWQADLKF